MRRVNLTDLARVIDRALKANVPLHLVGEPGIGKTEIVNAYSKSLGVPCWPLELAQCDQSDLGGIPVNVDGAIVRLPIGPVKGSSMAPGILFLDEYSQANPAQKGASLTLINERRAGDFRLHPDSRVILASNPEHSGANFHENPLPSINRMISVEVTPTLSEVQVYLCNLGQEGSSLRALGVDYSATLEVSPGLLQLSPPAGTVGRTWASPRAIVKGLQGLAACLDSGDEIDRDPVALALHAGAVGVEVSDAWFAIRAIRDRLASRLEILKDPEVAKLPRGIDAGIASIGVIGQVATEDPSAAWIYADRLEAETRAACGRFLQARAPLGSVKNQTRKASAERARARILGSTGARLGRAG